MDDKDEKVSYKDIHEKLWAARDFEINHLWQRSIFLATFITLTFTLYFSAVNKFIPDYPSYEAEVSPNAIEINVVPTDETLNTEKKFGLTEDQIHLIVLNVICLFGYSFAVLWICMARSSKYMYERLEGGINKAYESGSGFLDSSLDESVKEDFYKSLWNIGDHAYIPKHGSLPMSCYNYKVFSTDGGKFSSSRINILIGYIILFAWIALTIANPFVVEEEKFITLQPAVFCTTICCIVLWIFVFFGLRLFRVVSFTIFALPPIAMILSSTFAKIALSVTALLELFLFVFISWLTVSGHDMHLSDFISLVPDSIDPVADGNKKQVEFLIGLFWRDVPIARYVRNVLVKYQRLYADAQKQYIIQRFIERQDVRSIRILLSDEELRGVFETALMHRESFSSNFIGTWTGDKSDPKVVISNNHITITDKGKTLLDCDITTKGKSFEDSCEETRLFADTRWSKIRKCEPYTLGKDDRTMHIIHKDLNAETVYVTLSLEDSLSGAVFYDDKAINRMNVTWFVKGKTDAKDSEQNKPSSSSNPEEGNTDADKSKRKDFDSCTRSFDVLKRNS